MGRIVLEKINKIFPNHVHAVHDFSLVIEDGEFIVFVGPSGCGKTTTLRMIAGLESITSGTLSMDGVILNNMAPKDRDMAMVFQNYALYAHMTVYHNMAFSLTLRKEKSDLIHERVLKAAEVLELIPYLNRLPRQLSGGQRQRVALGRAIVRNPQCFLLDEPLSNLDAKLRGSMRKELTKLHQLLKTTFVYVTHDQVEAMTLADRIVVMKDGWIQQVGTPKEIYDYPCNTFVATFIGTPPMTLLEGVIDHLGNFVHNQGTIILADDDKLLLKNYYQKRVILGIRAEDFIISDSTINSLEATVEVVEYLGAELLLTGLFQNERFIARVSEKNKIKPQQVLNLGIKPNKFHFFDKCTFKRICKEENCEKR